MSFQVRILLVLTAALLPGSLALRGAEPGEREKAARARTDCYGDPLPAGAVARLGTVRFQNGGAVDWLAFSPDGKSLAAGDGRACLYLWDLATGKVIRHIHPLQQLWYGVSQDVCAPDGKIMATVLISQIELWDASTGKVLWELKGHESDIRDVHFAPDGRTIASASWDGSARLWETATGKEIRCWLGEKAFPESKNEEGLKGHIGFDTVAFSPDGKNLKGISRGKMFYLWDPATGKELRRVKLGMEHGYFLGFSPDDRWAASTESSGVIQLWDLTTGKEQAKIVLPLKIDTEVIKPNGQRLDQETILGFSPQWNLVVSGNRGADRGGWSDEIRLWDPATAKEAGRLEDQTCQVGTFTFSLDGKTLATGSPNGRIRLWDVASGQELPQSKNEKHYISKPLFSPDGSILVTVDRNSLVLWDPAQGKELRRLRGHVQEVHAKAFSPDGRYLASNGRSLASAGYHDTIRFWDLQTGKETSQAHQTKLRFVSMFFLPSNTLLAEDEIGQVFRIAPPWERLEEMPLPPFQDRYRYSPLAFSPDGTVGAVLDRKGRVYLWNPATGNVVRRLASKGNFSWCATLFFSPNGKLLLASQKWKTTHTMGHLCMSDVSAFQVWETATGKPLWHRLGKEDCKFDLVFRFSPDGRFLAAKGTDSNANIWLWDAWTGKTLGKLKDESRLDCFAFSPDSKTLAAGSTGGLVQLWETATGKKLRDWVGHRGGIASVVFSPDGKILASEGKEDNSVLLWDIMAP